MIAFEDFKKSLGVLAKELSDEQIERVTRSVSDLAPATVQAIRWMAEQAKEANLLRDELAAANAEFEAEHKADQQVVDNFERENARLRTKISELEKIVAFERGEGPL